MKKDEVQRVVQLRQFVINEYRSLEGLREPSAVIRQTEVATVYESIIKSIDDLISDYVTFDDGN